MVLLGCSGACFMPVCLPESKWCISLSSVITVYVPVQARSAVGIRPSFVIRVCVPVWVGSTVDTFSYLSSPSSMRKGKLNNVACARHIYPQTPTYTHTHQRGAKCKYLAVVSVNVYQQLGGCGDV